MLRKLFSFLRPRQKAQFLGVLVILALSAGLTQLTPLAIEYLTDHVLAEQSIRFQSVAPILLFILCANVVNEVIKVIRRLMVEDTATYIEKSARQRATEALLKAPLSYFRAHMTGNIHGRLNRNLEGTSKLIKLLFMDFAPAVASGMAAVAVIFAKLPLLVALSVVMVIPVGTLIVLRQISTQKGIRVELMETKAAMDGTMVELLGGIDTIRVLDSTQRELGRLEGRSERLRAKEMKHHTAMAFYDCLKFINEAVFNVVVIALTVLLAAGGTISIGTVLSTYLCFTQLTSPLRELHRILDEFSESMVLARDYFAIVELPTDFSYRLPAPRGGTDPAPGELELKGVSFSYPEKPEVKTLDHIDLRVERGKFVGIAGPSGCGKSTLIKLIAKLEPYEGHITIGGVDLDGLSRAELAERVALVPQSPFLVADTLYENICYGIKRPVSRAEVEEAARRACLSQVVEQLAGGYDFQVAEGGGNLSGGQRQRIALVRIFLRKPEILILDEATSALDNTTEKYIQTQIEEMQAEQSTTILSIAHRLTTLEHCDEIIVMDRGEIVQRGSFHALKETPGIFRDMHRGVLK
ncbi:ABC transporter ATP-binding protein [Pseudoflavonifractor phocaeensis]|nr:ABC transporter ATP-binding protein [Pseudoflavonifractor phocaeensis]